MREAIERLLETWESERYPDTGDAGWNQGYDMRRESDCAALREMLACEPKPTARPPHPATMIGRK